MSDVLALKYRPTTFEEVIGQDTTIRQLRASLENNTLGHALIFCGTRGSGKTTTARIVAHTLNTGIPPAELRMLVTEVDAASNTGVDNVREIIENVRYSRNGHQVVTIDECFPYATPIHLANGSTKPIGEIVSKELPVEVLSYNKKTGCVEKKRVSNWIRKKAKEYNFIRIQTSHKNSFSCTEDHKIYTPGGLIRAADLKENDTIYCNEVLSDLQKVVLTGTVLGDGCLSLSRGKDNARLHIKHGEKQAPYADFKHKIFQNCVGTPPKTQKNGGFGEFSRVFTTKSHPTFKAMYDRFYDKLGRKVITSSAFQNFNNLSLAFLYMDDGSLGKNSIQISTDNFSEEDNYKLAEYFKQEYKLNFKIYPNRGKGTFFLCLLGRAQLDAFFHLVAPFVHPSLDYKLPPQFRGGFVGEDFFVSKNPGIEEAPITKITRASYYTNVYDLTVEDNHNYFVGKAGFLVSNCHMLSKSAFNALLKTLEEPPPGVTFILLTTEPHKLIATVKSRCQIYEFNDVPLETLKSYYTEIAKKEGLELSSEAIESIALKAEGSVRDGLTLLQKHLSGEEVVDNAKQYFELVGAIYGGDVTTALALVGEIHKSEESRIIIQTLERWFYWASLEFFGMKTPIRELLSEGAAANFELTKLQNLFSKCLGIERDFYATPNSKIVLQMGIINLTL